MIEKQKEEDAKLQEAIAPLRGDTLVDGTQAKMNFKVKATGINLSAENLEAYSGSPLLECQNYSLLMASHIMPWRKANNLQRLDIYNGLLLIPNMDKLFDRGYISFSKTGKIIFPEFLSNEDKRIFNLTSSLRLVHLEEGHLPYLQYHREYCLL